MVLPQWMNFFHLLRGNPVGESGGSKVVSHRLVGADVLDRVRGHDDSEDDAERAETKEEVMVSVQLFAFQRRDDVSKSEEIGSALDEEKKQNCRGDEPLHEVLLVFTDC